MPSPDRFDNSNSNSNRKKGGLLAARKRKFFRNPKIVRRSARVRKQAVKDVGGGCQGGRALTSFLGVIYDIS